MAQLAKGLEGLGKGILGDKIGRREGADEGWGGMGMGMGFGGMGMGMGSGMRTRGMGVF